MQSTEVARLRNYEVTVALLEDAIGATVANKLSIGVRSAYSRLLCIAIDESIKVALRGKYVM